MENNMGVPQEFENRSTMWHGNPTFGFFSAEIQNTHLKTCMHLYGPCHIIYNSPDKEATEESIVLDKQEVLHIYNNILFGCNKE